MVLITVKIEPTLGADVRDIFMEAKALSARIECPVEFEANRVNVLISSSTDLDMLYDKFMDAMGSSHRYKSIS